MNIGDPSTFFQVFIQELLAEKPEMKGIDSSWIQSIEITLSNGLINKINLGVSFPVKAKIPNSIKNVLIKTEIKNGLVANRTVFVQINFI
jgi:hypothetical protein